MNRNDVLIGLYEIGQELIKLQKSVESPDVLIARELLKILVSGVDLINRLDDSGEETTELRSASNDLLKGFDNLLLQSCISHGGGDRTDKLLQVRRGIQRQIEMNKPCPVERKEVKTLKRAVAISENAVKAFSMMLADKQVKPSDMVEVRSVLKTNLTGYRKRLNQLVHGPIAIRSDADSLSERCSKLLQSELVKAL